jgi:hypothetical protein
MPSCPRYVFGSTAAMTDAYSMLESERATRAWTAASRLSERFASMARCTTSTFSCDIAYPGSPAASSASSGLL